MDYSEKEVEETLVTDPSSIDLGIDGLYIELWLGNQVKVPSGIIDLYGSLNNGDLIVVELKKVPATSSAIGQVIRYRQDIESILSKNGESRKVFACVAAPVVDNIQTFYEAMASDVILSKLVVELDARVLPFSNAMRELREAYVDEIEQAAKRSIFEMLKKIPEDNHDE